MRGAAGVGSRASLESDIGALETLVGAFEILVGALETLVGAFETLLVLRRLSLDSDIGVLLQRLGVLLLDRLLLDRLFLDRLLLDRLLLDRLLLDRLLLDRLLLLESDIARPCGVPLGAGSFGVGAERSRLS